MKYCQFNEEELLEPLLPAKGYFVEIGCLPDHKFSNTKHLHDKGWKGVWIDKFGNEEIHEATVTADNINQVLKKLKVPKHIDLMSIDIDGNDYYVFEALTYKPKVLVIEYNRMMEDGKMERNDTYEWKGGWGFGSSKKEMLALAEKKGYYKYAENESNLILCLVQ